MNKVVVHGVVIFKINARYYRKQKLARSLLLLLLSIIDAVRCRIVVLTTRIICPRSKKMKTKDVLYVLRSEYLYICMKKKKKINSKLACRR